MLTFIIPLLFGTILGFLIRGKPSETFAITKGRRAAWGIGVWFVGIVAATALITTSPTASGLIGVGLGYGVFNVLSMGSATHRKWVEHRAPLWLTGGVLALLIVAESLVVEIRGIFPISDAVPIWLVALVVLPIGLLVDSTISQSCDKAIDKQQPNNSTDDITLKKSDGSVEAYGEALREFESTRRDDNLYARLLAECDGDEAKVRARYIAFRATQHSATEPIDVGSRVKPNIEQVRMPSPMPSLLVSTSKKSSSTLAIDSSLSDEECFRTYRFSVLAEGTMRLYKFDNGNFAVRRGNQFYVYSNYDDAYTVYGENSMSRDVYLKRSTSQFTC